MKKFWWIMNYDYIKYNEWIVIKNNYTGTYIIHFKII